MNAPDNKSNTFLLVALSLLAGIWGCSSAERPSDKPKAVRVTPQFESTPSEPNSEEGRDDRWKENQLIFSSASTDGKLKATTRYKNQQLEMVVEENGVPLYTRFDAIPLSFDAPAQRLAFIGSVEDFAQGIFIWEKTTNESRQITNYGAREDSSVPTPLPSRIEWDGNLIKYKLKLEPGMPQEEIKINVNTGNIERYRVVR